MFRPNRHIRLINHGHSIGTSPLFGPLQRNRLAAILPHDILAQKIHRTARLVRLADPEPDATVRGGGIFDQGIYRPLFLLALLAVADEAELDAEGKGPRGRHHLQAIPLEEDRVLLQRIPRDGLVDRAVVPAAGAQLIRPCAGHHGWLPLVGDDRLR